MAFTERRISASTTAGSRINSKTSALDWVAVALVVIGGLNWGLVGLFDFDLVAFLFGAMTGAARVVYTIVAIVEVYAIFSFTKLSVAGR